MHEIYKLTPLHKNPAQLDVQIECIAAYDEYLLLGTRQGFLLMYNISKSSDPTEDIPEIELRRYNKSFSKKAIQQLDVIPEAQLLICLTDNIVQVHNLAAINFPLIHSIAGSKGATLFTFHTIKEASLTGTTSVTVRLCIAVKRKLQLYYWKKNEFLTLAPEICLTDMPKTISWCMESICVGYRNEYILYMLNDEQKQLFPTSSTRPSDPCITKATANTFALAKDKQTILVNNLGIVESAYALRWSDEPSALAWDEPYALAIIGDSIEIQTTEPGATILQSLKELRKVRFLVQCSQGVLYAASISQVWCLHAVDVSLQRNILLENKQFELALSLTDISKESEDEKQKMRIQIQTELAYKLFNNKKFKESMQQFLKLGTNTYDVIRLFPELLPSQQQLVVGTSGSNEQLDIITDALTGRDLEEGLVALIDYLTEVRHKLLGETQSNVNASGNLNEHLAATKQTQQLLQIIDTTLLKCYLQTNDAMIAPLLRRNHCHMAEAERTLKKHDKYNELIILYQTKGLHRCALDWLRTENHVDRTISYLQHLGSEEIGLIFEFAEWVLRAAPEEALRIFTEDLVEVEGLPRPRVLDYLLRSHPKLVVPYLQHVLGVWEDNNPLFHNALVHQYREKAGTVDDPGAEIYKNKLLEFLDESKYYTPESVLMHFPTDSFFEERANILGKMKKYEYAIVIFVRVMGDLTKATNYCNKIWKNNIINEVYIILIKLLLDPSCITVSLPGVPLSPKTAQPDLEAAITLIEEYADRLDPLRVIAILPKDIVMSRLTKFFQVSLHNAIQCRRQVQLLKGLLKSEHLRCLDEKLQLESQYVLITDMNVCPVCKKRFGNQSALVRYSNGNVVHFSCHEKKM